MWSVLLAMMTAAGAGEATDTRFSQQRLREVEAFVVREAEQARIPGFALAVSTKTGVLLAVGHGASNPEGTPITANTPLQIGSLTKSFTALATLQLAEAGKLDLDAPVEQYLPEFRSGTDGNAQRITVRHLLNQTSGLSALDGFGGSSRSERVAELLSMAGTRPEHPPGQRFQYSNANYELLGLVVEQVSGTSYPEFIRRSIFEPLGMTNTYADAWAAAQKGELAWGHQNWFGINHRTRGYLSPPVLSAGGICSSASDMGRYLAAHLNDGEFNGVRLAGSDRFGELHHPPGDFSSYAMGWSVRKVGEHSVLLHNGSTPHFTATMLVAPDAGVGIVVLTNTNVFNLPFVELHTRRIATGALRTLLGETVPAVGAKHVWGELFTKLLLLLGLVGSVLALFRQIRRWRKAPESWTKFTVGFLLDLAVVGLLLWGVPQLFGIPIRSLVEYVPDVGAMLILGLALAFARLAMRAAFAWRGRPNRM